MEAHFPRKVLAMHGDLTSSIIAWTVNCADANFVCLIISLSDHLSVCQPQLCVLVLIRTQSGWLKHVCQWFHKCCLDKTTIPGTLNSLSLLIILPFCFARNASWFILLNWIHSKIISTMDFHINALIKTPGIQFLPLDWIYYNGDCIEDINGQPLSPSTK